MESSKSKLKLLSALMLLAVVAGGYTFYGQQDKMSRLAIAKQKMGELHQQMVAKQLPAAPSPALASPASPRVEASASPPFQQSESVSVGVPMKSSDPITAASDWLPLETTHVTTSTPATMPLPRVVSSQNAELRPIIPCRLKDHETLLSGLTGPAGDRLWDDIISRCRLDEYQVKNGDTLPSISRYIFGEARYWPKIWSNNPAIDQPYDLHAGQLLTFHRSWREPTSEDEAAMNWYEVQPEQNGMTLSDLAEKLGSRSWAKDLERQNPKIKNTRRLPAGQILKIDTRLLSDE